MISENKLQELRKQCLGVAVFPEEVIDWIAQENLWNIWVPKNYGGLELAFSEGLRKLQEAAKIDGSLGWTITLCSGANYFVGNLKEATAREIFLPGNTSVCLGGSGGVSGTAEKQGDQYKISGRWRYATGANYLSHFTLNAEILEDGVGVRQEDGSAKVLSFVLPREDVQIIEDWNAMGLKASVTHSFEVENVMVHERFSFQYNTFYQPQAIFRIPFSGFADLTLWVNYIGMAEHFLEEVGESISMATLKQLKDNIISSNQRIYEAAEMIEGQAANDRSIAPGDLEEIHHSASKSVRDISRNIIEIYPLLGVKASRNDHQLNQIFRDYFTATQHHIFTK